MKVWAVSICCCDEYGCMELFGIYRTEEEAHEAAMAAGFQNEDSGEDVWHARTDYYDVSDWEI